MFSLQVEEGSPAQAAGLKEGDRIIEVNGANINGEVHKQVVSRIKENPNETKLLVVDKESSEYFQANDITITGSMSEVKKKKIIFFCFWLMTEGKGGEGMTRRKERTDSKLLLLLSPRLMTTPTPSFILENESRFYRDDR